MNLRASDESQHRFGRSCWTRSLARGGVPVEIGYRAFETLLAFVRPHRVAESSL
jgi:hypothetical protein